MMTAEVVSVGTELLLGQITDTNAAYLGQVLAELGIPIYRRQTVGDNLERVTEAMKTALSRADLLVTIGGLGPTEDDLTRDGIAAAIGEELIVDPEVEAHLKELFEKRGIRYTQSQIRQAQRPPSGRPIPNANGTAPGLIIEKEGKIVIALPGPPNEFRPMIDDQVAPFLREKSGGNIIRSRTIRITGMGESTVEEKVQDLIHNENPTVAPLAHLGEVHLRVTARAPTREEADALIAPMEAAIRERLGEVVYGVDNETLETAVVKLLRSQKSTLSTAESCSGGLLAHRITNVPGSSEVFMGGLVTYSNAMKIRYLGVPETTLQQFGAVSRETALAMAKGVREQVRTEWGIGITGIAGPDGGSPEKPVGLVYIALADGSGVYVEEFRFIGQRETVKQRASQAALTLLRRAILRGGCESLSQS